MDDALYLLLAAALWSAIAGFAWAAARHAPHPARSPQ